MKKVIFALCAVALLFASCADKNAYTIKGTLIGEAKTLDGVMVHLYNDDDWEVALDSAMVKDGKFEFKGTQSTPIIRFVGTFILDEKRFSLPVILEAGEITLTVDEWATVSGTPLNNTMQKFNSMMDDKYKKIELTYNQIEENPEDEAVSASMTDLQQDLMQSAKDFIKQNADNVLGRFYFVHTASALGVDEQKELLALFPESLKDDPRISKIAADVAKQEAVSKVGKKFTDIKGLTINGKEASLSDYAGKGKVVLLDFWASWCGPCIQELPHVKKAYDTYKDKGFEIVGVSLDEKHDAWKKATEQHGITWPQFSNLKGWDEDGAKAYGVKGIPYTVLIDKDGTIVAESLRGGKLLKKLGELLDK